MVSGRTKQTLLLFPGISLFTHRSLEQVSRDCSRNTSWYGTLSEPESQAASQHVPLSTQSNAVLGFRHECPSKWTVPNSLASLFLNKLLFGHKTSDYSRIPQGMHGRYRGKAAGLFYPEDKPAKTWKYMQVPLSCELLAIFILQLKVQLQLMLTAEIWRAAGPKTAWASDLVSVKFFTLLLFLYSQGVYNGYTSLILSGNRSAYSNFYGPLRYLWKI